MPQHEGMKSSTYPPALPEDDDLDYSQGKTGRSQKQDLRNKTVDKLLCFDDLLTENGHNLTRPNHEIHVL